VKEEFLAHWVLLRQNNNNNNNNNNNKNKNKNKKKKKKTELNIGGLIRLSICGYYMFLMT